MDWVWKILQAAGTVVDVAVPVGVGDRTKVSAVVAAAAPVVGKIACLAYPPACPIVGAVGTIAALAVPLFAGAGLVRSK